MRFDEKVISPFGTLNCSAATSVMRSLICSAAFWAAMPFRSEPEDAAVAVEYRGHWYWIDDRDLRSKHSFTLMMIMFTLANAGQKGQLPLITIPAE